MSELKITVRSKIATADGQRVVCGNSDYQVRFDLDTEWDAYTTKTMRVVYHDHTYTDVVFAGAVAALPVIENQSVIRVGLFAGNLHTTTPALFPCELSILSGTGSPVDPTSSVYDQIMAALNNKANSNQGIANAGKYWKVGTDGSLVFAAGAGSAEIYMRVDNDYIQYSTDNETWTNVIAVADLKGETGATGATGASGADGKSAYASAQDGGYTGAEAQFNSDLAGVSTKQDILDSSGANANVIAPLYVDTGELRIALGNGLHEVDNDLEVEVKTDGGITLDANGISVDTAIVQPKATTQTVTIAVSDWNGGTTCTKSVTGVTASNIVICDSSDTSVQCTAQAAGTLTFTADATPSAEVTVKVVILP